MTDFILAGLFVHEAVGSVIMSDNGRIIVARASGAMFIGSATGAVAAHFGFAILETIGIFFEVSLGLFLLLVPIR